jgi:hypothetical protein
MGLFMIRARFDGPPPSEEAFRRELAALAGDIHALDGVHIDGNLLEVTTMFDGKTYPYACKLILRLGGQLLDFRTLEPRTQWLPAFVERPWHEWPWWKRALIHVQFLLGLASTALPRRRDRTQ